MDRLSWEFAGGMLLILLIYLSFVLILLAVTVKSDNEEK